MYMYMLPREMQGEHSANGRLGVRNPSATDLSR